MWCIKRRLPTAGPHVTPPRPHLQARHVPRVGQQVHDECVHAVQQLQLLRLVVLVVGRVVVVVLPAVRLQQ